MNLKRPLTIILILIILIIDWLALDDITTTNEPAPFGEYVIHLITSIIVGYLVIQKSYVFLFNLQRNIAKSILSTKYHIHHDLVGLILVISGYFVGPLLLQVTLAGVGVGLISHHVKTEGFKFITKY